MTSAGRTDAIDTSALAGGVPLLAIRIGGLEDVAWREGAAAAARLERAAIRALEPASNGIVRSGDVLAHRSGSDRFGVALLVPPRDSGGSNRCSPAALVRISAAVSRVTGREVQAAWQTLHAGDAAGIGAAIDSALEHAVRERERGELLATLGHELRTPLTSIQGYLETLTGDQLDAAGVRRFAAIAHQEAVRLGRMLDGMLKVSLLDLSPAHSSARCDAAAATHAALSLVAPSARSRGIALHGRVAPAAAAIGAVVLEHAVTNLCDNAVRWARTAVRVRCGCESDAVVIVVDDDGAGITPSQRARIFDFGVRGPAAPAGGSGVGLAIVRSAAESCGGSVEAGDAPGGGARFTLRLPRYE